MTRTYSASPVPNIQTSHIIADPDIEMKEQVEDMDVDTPSYKRKRSPSTTTTTPERQQKQSRLVLEAKSNKRSREEEEDDAPSTQKRVHTVKIKDIPKFTGEKNEDS